MKKKLLLLFLLCSVPSFATHTCGVGVGTGECFISQAGSDTNTGATSGAAWLHAPGMAGCSGNCSTQVAQAGDQYVFRGGDTWGSGNFPWTWSTNGGTSAGARVYIGVDQTFFTGGSWTRPIMDCGGTCNKQLKLASSTNFYQIDNIEWKGLFDNSTTPAFEQIYSVDVHNATQGNSASDIILSSNYFHAANVLHDGTQDSTFVLWATSTDTHSVASNNVWDNSDGAGNAPNVMMCIYGDVPFMFGNTCRYTANGFIQAGGTAIHDNLIEFIYVSVDAATHSNAFESNSDCNLLLYGNVIRHIQTASFVQFQMSPNASCTSYAFNNVFYDTLAGNGMQCFESGGGGTCQFFNNTAACGATGNLNISCGRATGTDPGVWTNNHFITSGTTLTGGAVTNTTPITQTESTASGQGYTSLETYAYSPTASSNATVSSTGGGSFAGTSIVSICSTINGLYSPAGTDCLNDTRYGATYNSTNHTSQATNRTTTARGGSGATPNAGAFEFNQNVPIPSSTRNGAFITADDFVSLPADFGKAE